MFLYHIKIFIHFKFQVIVVATRISQFEFGVLLRVHFTMSHSTQDHQCTHIVDTKHALIDLGLTKGLFNPEEVCSWEII